MLFHKDCHTIVLGTADRDNLKAALLDAVESARCKAQYLTDDVKAGELASVPQSIDAMRSDARDRAKANHRILKNLLEALV